MTSALFAAAGLALASQASHGFGVSSVGDSGGVTNTEFWVGAEYTPSAAPGNGFWWNWYDSYEPGVKRELAAVAKHLKLTAIRVWLMWEVFDANPAQLHANMERFLTIASRNNISVGFVFFGDCFHHSGGSLVTQCTPQKGVHNGCWMSSPQDVHRQNSNSTNRYAPLQPYVFETITKFRGDGRILWWEIFNEPKRDTWSLGLRNEAYGWAKAAAPVHPVISCWDDSNNTDIVDHHDYGTNFTHWKEMLYSNPRKGALVTEGGSRWYQPDPGPATGASTNQADQGSPLTVLNFLSALREEKKQGKVPYVPGAIICWELMVGNSNTRWHWATAAGTDEPAIPWDAWVFPDGTPISFTEVAAFRRYVTGHDEFLRFDDFLPKKVANGDFTLQLTAGRAFTVPPSTSLRSQVTRSLPRLVTQGLLQDGLFEAAVWATFPGDGNITMVVRAQPIEFQKLPSHEKDLGACSQENLGIIKDLDIVGDNFAGINYRTLDLSKEAYTQKACEAACCGWPGCGAWVVKSGTLPSVTDSNCTEKTKTCCWLKPKPNGQRKPKTKSQPRGQPSPSNISGYHVVLVGASNTLLVERRDAQGVVRTLGHFNISSLENGLVLEAWNMLRVLVVTNDNQVQISVWFNPMFSETGFVGNSSDAERMPNPLPPRLVLSDTEPLPPGELVLTAGHRDSMVDYASALPTEVMLKSVIEYTSFYV